MKWAVTRGNLALRPNTIYHSLAKASIKIYCQERAVELGEALNRRRQANTLTRDDIVRLVKHLADEAAMASTQRQIHRRRAAILALLFSYGAPCRVGDLHHTRWWSFKIRQDEEGEYLRMQPAWLKNSAKVQWITLVKNLKNSRPM